MSNKWVHIGGGEVVTEEYKSEGQIIVDHICNCEVVNGVSVNANLIAAAPELLEALQDALHAFDKHGEHSEWDYARAAIAKALGK